jgi:hypothetical protein
MRRDNELEIRVPGRITVLNTLALALTLPRIAAA